MTTNQMEGRCSREVGGRAVTAPGGGDGEQRQQTHPPAPASMGFKKTKNKKPLKEWKQRAFPRAENQSSSKANRRKKKNHSENFIDITRAVC